MLLQRNTRTHPIVLPRCGHRTLATDAWESDWWFGFFTASKVWKVAICLDRQNSATALTAKMYPLCVLPHCIQIMLFKCGCGREGQHLSRLWMYVKHYTYCRILEGSCFLLCFPPNWFSQLKAVRGAGRAANKTDSGEPLSDPRLGSNNTGGGITIAPLGCW